MAIDSSAKRIAAQGVGRPWKRASLPGPLTESKRASIGNAYYVSSLSDPVPQPSSVAAEDFIYANIYYYTYSYTYNHVSE